MTILRSLVTRPRLLDPRPQRGLLRYWLLRAAVAGVLFAMLVIALAGGRDDWAKVAIGMAVVACSAVLIVRAVVRRDPRGTTLVDDL